jgi:hypothetical protein
MQDTKYNGWTNYATWRINLEIFDGFNPKDYFEDADGNWTDELAENIRQYALDVVCPEADGSLQVSYAYAFMSEVNWHEIAEHLINDYSEVTA